jgi:hypothetical protein
LSCCLNLGAPPVTPSALKVSLTFLGLGGIVTESRDGEQQFCWLVHCRIRLILAMHGSIWSLSRRVQGCSSGLRPPHACTTRCLRTKHSPMSMCRSSASLFLLSPIFCINFINFSHATFLQNLLRRLLKKFLFFN